MANPRHMLGRRAEQVAAAWLESSGWHVLATRWRIAEGELDLVCLDPSWTLVGVEVRARRTERSGSALESLDARRLARLRAALGRYAAQAAPAHRGLRLDLVVVRPSRDGWQVKRLAGVDAW
jgi:putative endonuclease